MQLSEAWPLLHLAYWERVRGQAWHQQDPVPAPPSTLLIIEQVRCFSSWVGLFPLMDLSGRLSFIKSQGFQKNPPKKTHDQRIESSLFSKWGVLFLCFAVDFIKAPSTFFVFVNNPIDSKWKVRRICERNNHRQGLKRESLANKTGKDGTTWGKERC